VVIAGREIVAPANGGLGETLAAGRDAVDEAADEESAAAPTAGRDPVAEADAGALAPALGRTPVAEADGGEIGFGAAPLAAVAAPGAPAAAAGIRVVPHCTQNFAPGWVS
jgi:hypothetical protein